MLDMIDSSTLYLHVHLVKRSIVELPTARKQLAAHAMPAELFLVAVSYEKNPNFLDTS